MTTNANTTSAGPKSETSSAKSYRSVTEIRRAFYPKAGEKRAAKAGSRAKNAFLGGEAKADGTL